jgi:serpin B
METNLILTLIGLAITVIVVESVHLSFNRRKKFMTILKSPPQATEWWSSLDVQWQAIFKAAIGIKSEPTAEELVAILSLTQLDCHSKELTSLEPLRALTGLQTLNCGGNQLTSLEPLRALTGLQTLGCRDNHLTSLEPLRALTGLQNLECAANQLTSLEPLRALTDLQTLNCLGNQLTNLEPLRACSGLRVLHCGWNYLTSLEPLQACPDLQTLNCRSNELTNLEPLRACPGLQTLDCGGNQLTSLEPLRALTGLQTLNCCVNQLTNLEPLHGLKSLKQFGCRSNPSLSQPEIKRFKKAVPFCQEVDLLGSVLMVPSQVNKQTNNWWSSLDTRWQAIFQGAIGIGIDSEPTETEMVAILNLTKLDCRSKGLTSLEPLRALTGLQTLNCGGNQLTSLEPLRALTGLQTLDCGINQLTSLEPLQALTSLQSLVCGNNQLTSLEPLRALTGLQSLNCGSNQLTSLEPLQALTGLQSLVCGSNQLTNLEPLQALTGLQTLDCGSNQLTSLEPLRALTGLQTLDCGNNQLTSLEPLRALTGLQTLYCGNNQLTSLEPLQALMGLQTLDCRENQLTSLEGLQAYPGLQSLDYQQNQLTSLEGLQACLGLQRLDCADNQLTSLEPLHGLKSLWGLNCRNNPSLSEPEIEHFQKAVPSCGVHSTAEDQRRDQRRNAENQRWIEEMKIEDAKQRERAKLEEQRVTAELGIDKIVPANNHFGFRLFDQLLQQDLGKNVFMSPASVTIALAMTYNGAAGHTQTAMAKTLGLENLTLEEVNQANLALRNVLLHQANSDMSLLIANSLWLNQDFRLEPAFLTPTQQYYAANVTNADFQSPTTVSDINQWVHENTQGKIGPMVQHLDPLTTLVIINAIYFKGTWEKPFKKRDTKEREFTLLTGETKRVPMMYQESYYSYYQGNNYQAVRLPYKGSSLSMTVFLPDRGTRLENFPLRDHWQEWRAGNTPREGTLVLPRFNVEYEVTLNEALQALGMAEAFSQDQADFSQMAKVPKSQNIYLSQVKHKTFVEVNEEGTEAAAVTCCDMEMGECVPEPEPFEMIIDHPFLFTIQDDSTGTVLFLGAIVEPK